MLQKISRDHRSPVKSLSHKLQLPNAEFTSVPMNPEFPLGDIVKMGQILKSSTCFRYSACPEILRNVAQMFKKRIAIPNKIQ